MFHLTITSGLFGNFLVLPVLPPWALQVPLGPCPLWSSPGISAGSPSLHHLHFWDRILPYFHHCVGSSVCWLGTLQQTAKLDLATITADIPFIFSPLTGTLELCWTYPMAPHIHRLCSDSYYYQQFQLCTVGNSLTQDATAKLIHYFITSSFDLYPVRCFNKRFKSNSIDQLN